MCTQLLGPAENCYGMAVAVVEINKVKEKGQHVLRGKVVLAQKEETLWPFVQPLLMANFWTKSLHSDFSHGLTGCTALTSTNGHSPYYWPKANWSV